MTEFSNILESYLVPTLENKYSSLGFEEHPFIENAEDAGRKNLAKALRVMEKKYPSEMDTEMARRVKTCKKVLDIMNQVIKKLEKTDVLEREFKYNPPRDFLVRMYYSKHQIERVVLEDDSCTFTFTACPRPMPSPLPHQYKNKPSLWYDKEGYSITAFDIITTHPQKFINPIKNPIAIKIKNEFAQKLSSDECVVGCDYLSMDKWDDDQNGEGIWKCYTRADCIITVKPTKGFLLKLKECGYDAQTGKYTPVE